VSALKGNVQARISEFAKFGSKLGLDNIRELCNLLGNPEKDLKVVHVAGTNGKGSVSRYIYEVLLSLGYTAGIFSSPYVREFNERIEANGKMISDEALFLHTDRVLEAAKSMKTSPTEFEILTAIGFSYFEEQDLDFVVLEVGLGGRGDSTNIIDKPLVSVITGISLDHTDRLGETEAEIAAEKAGIIKSGCPVVSGATGEAAKVIARKAYELRAPLVDSSKVKYFIHERTLGGYDFSAIIDSKRYDHIEISMVGEHQVRNAVTALVAIEYLRMKKYISLDSGKLKEGMLSAKLPARFEVASADPLVIVDGAHNAEGASVLVDTLRVLLPEKKILFVTSILKDKDAEGILAKFLEASAGIVLTESANEKATPVGELEAKVCSAADHPVYVEADPRKAYALALSLAGDYDAIVIAGSLYLVSDIFCSGDVIE
jgi:dihydrofolate synthase/folylpolyglutamate synthase